MSAQSQAQTPSDRANARQLEASDPSVSAFVAASAGSGKTKLLIDRLLRLMLGGADPARIQCLTFTKAAAAEMALRLQRVLGEWVTLDEASLAAALAALHMPDVPHARARSLFARVLDLPGGMRIGTIHAFCQSLLRRFPLEASLVPHFRLLEDADAHMELEGAREDALLSADPAAVQVLAGLLNASQFGKLIVQLRPRTTEIRALMHYPADERRALLRRAAGVTGDDAALLAEAVDWAGADALRAAVVTMQARGSDSIRTRGEVMFGWLNLPPDLRATHWDRWVETMLTKEGAPRGATTFCNKLLSNTHPHIQALCLAECERVIGVEDSRRTLRMVEATAALITLAAPVLAGFETRKQLAGELDYDDLILRTSALLLDPGTAWVLFKLDGGLDHLLLDEVQDTSRGQWEIAGALTAEFFAGESATDGARTVFAVGDRKQSIYSFQGADPAGFDSWRARMRDRVRSAGGTFRDTALDVSFRSTSAVLALVDAVFADPVAASGVAKPGTLHHQAHRAGQAGRVELWPLVPRPDNVPHEPWAVADRNHGLSSAPQRLAEQLAGWIAAQVGVARLEGRGRCLHAGDVLVLVRRRDNFATALVRRLKLLGVPVAGLDRLVLTQQPSVQDLLSLCDTLLLPEDDLSLACVLTSPLGGLNDDDLMALAIGREGTLWDALRARHAERPAWRAAWEPLAALQRRADFVAPHALLSEALGALGGRARLLRRLGPEASEPIDEMLTAALAYAASHPASLQGFVQWLRNSGAEVKRQAEEAGGLVRIMTVHGAKGLQAPLVILPDTTAVPPDSPGVLWTADGLPLWSPRSELRCGATDALRTSHRQAAMEEYNRLLYVAMTRAEDWLVVCGWDTNKVATEDCWYSQVQRGMASLDTANHPLGVPEPWADEKLVHEVAQTAMPSRAVSVTATVAGSLPAWAGAAPGWTPEPLPAEPSRPIPLAPSRPADAMFGPVPDAGSPILTAGPRAAALARGTLIHAILQHLPVARNDEELQAAVHRMVRHHGGAGEIATEVLGILRHPALTGLFGPMGRPEQPVTGLVHGVVVSGVIDRLAVLPGRVVVADFKTSRTAPDSPVDVPVLYLRQMASYRTLLRSIFPAHAIECLLVWTRSAAVMTLPDSLLDAQVPRWVDTGAARDHVE